MCVQCVCVYVPEDEEKKKGSEKIFEEIIVETFPKMGKEIVTQVQEAQRAPYKINPRRNTPDIPRSHAYSTHAHTKPHVFSSKHHA